MLDGMAICDICTQEMTTAKSCTAAVLHRDGVPTSAFTHGNDPGWGRARGRCGDCGVQPGGYHHLGCDIQACPRCRGQLISCDCAWDELGRTDEDWDEEDEDDDVVVVLQPRTTTGGRPLQRLTLAAAVAPLRARFHGELVSLAAWCSAEGRSCDLDGAALCLAAMARQFGVEAPRLTRPGINTLVWAGVRNEAAILGTMYPDDYPEQLWNVLCWKAATGQLDEASDPLPALLEPLQCWGGLDPDGKPRPDGVDVDFPCQCYVPHDPTLPAGQHQYIVGQHTKSHAPLIARVRLVARSDDPGVSNFAPLFKVMRRIRKERDIFDVHPEEFEYVGRIDPARSSPELWLYRYAGEDGSGRVPLAVDAEGCTWLAKPDSRRKAGFRWTPIETWRGIRFAGLTPSFREPEQTFVTLR